LLTEGLFGCASDQGGLGAVGAAPDGVDVAVRGEADGGVSFAGGIGWDEGRGGDAAAVVDAEDEGLDGVP